MQLTAYTSEALTETLKRRTLDLATLTLEKGAHPADHTFCVMEAVAFIAGESWSDTPRCVSLAIGAFLRNWNDSVDDAFRQRLKPYIERVLDTRTTAADEETRAWLATDWLVRVQVPAWLDLAGLADDATALRNLPALTSSEIAVAVQSVLESARQRAAAARDAAWAAAWDAAENRLAPTVAQLQESAFTLLDAMIAVGRVSAPQEPQK